MADMLKFKKGMYAQLPTTISAGTIYVTEDERAMYVDVNESTRIRLGDIIQYDSYKNFRNVKPPFNEKAFYYLVDENALLKYRGTDPEGNHVWQQVNSVSDIQADLTALTTRVQTAEGNITGLQTAVTNITKADGAIAAAKQEAINAAAADAQTKANAAETNAKSYADGLVSDLTEVVNGKADESALTAAVSTLEDKITQAKADAATDATTKANAAQSAAEKTAADALKAAKEEIQGKLDLKANKADVDATVATLETKTDASAKLTEAKGYTDTEIEKVTKKVTANTTAITDEASRADQAEKALGLRIDGVVSDIGGINTTIGSLATKTELSDQKKALEGQIATAKAGAISEAKTYTDGEIGKVNTEVAKKADAATVEASFATVNKAITDGDKATLSAAETKAGELAEAAKTSANTYTDGKVTDLNNAIALKADSETLTTAVSTLRGEIAAAQEAAATDAQTKANTAESNAKSYADTEISKAKTALEGKIALKADQSALNQAIADLQAYADQAEADANAYADNKVAQALAEADAMTFRGTVSLSKDLPTSGVQCGDTYKVAEKGTYAGNVCFVGDLLIASADQGKEDLVYAGGWEHISSGYEDDYDPVLSVDADNNKVFLRNTVGVERGSVTFAAADESVNVSVTGEADPTTGIANTTVTIGIEWGSF